MSVRAVPQIRAPIAGILTRLRDPGDPAGVAEAFEAAAPSLDRVPVPGGGETWQRLAFLARVGAASPALARLVEGHLDALAILGELAAPVPDDARLGVWAAEPRGQVIEAARTARGWRLRGTKPYASGAGLLTHALVTARAGADRLLLLVDAQAWHALPESWPAVGMEASDSPTVVVNADVSCTALVGGPGAYLQRPGFWHGGVGVAAVWHGGATGVAKVLRRHAAASCAGPHALAHLGAVETALACSDALLRRAATAIDDDPDDRSNQAERRTRVVRAAVERNCAETLDRVGRALGAGPLCHDRAHARRVADLSVYLRQSHAEADLEALGRLLAADATTDDAETPA